MVYKRLIEKRDLLNKNKNLLSEELIENYTTNFDINFAHDSTAIEGNTLTLIETKLLIEDKISVGSKSLREIYEVVNHNKAWEFVKKNVKEKNDLNEDIVKEIHRILMENISEGGTYRDADVIITGAKHNPPSHFIIRFELDNFYNTLKENNFNELALVAYTHAEFVRIHPFINGNGRLSRIIMNYQLLQNGFLPISIKTENKGSYYDALEEYGVNDNLNSLIELIHKLEEDQLDFYLKHIKHEIR
ncbi:MAG: Fic family protein [Methanobrevibacter sp.]|jgi:Fic family protein|nr:Fic family protein [Candidatus Methanovirga meridionalis]